MKIDGGDINMATWFRCYYLFLLNIIIISLHIFVAQFLVPVLVLFILVIIIELMKIEIYAKVRFNYIFIFEMNANVNPQNWILKYDKVESILTIAATLDNYFFI